MNKITELCISEKISPNSFFLLYKLTYPKSNNIPLSDEEEQMAYHHLWYYNYIDESNAPTNKGKRLIADYISTNKKIPKAHIDKALYETEILTYVDDYRKLFKGLKPGSMGDKKGCTDKLVEFYKQYPDFANKDLILKATKGYINSMNDYRFLTQADYFIYKYDVNKNRISKLASFCEEVDMEKEDKGFTKMV